MMFPGPQPIHGNGVSVIVSGVRYTVPGAASVRGILDSGRGYIELRLPDADPEQRRALEKTAQLEFWLYQDGALLYSSPPLSTIKEIRRADDGALIVTAAP